MIKIKNLLKIGVLLFGTAFSMLSIADQDAADSLTIKQTEKNKDASIDIQKENVQFEISTVENLQNVNVNVNLSEKENTVSSNVESNKSESISEAVLGANANENSSSTLILENQKEKISFETTSSKTENKKIENVSSILNMASVNEKDESEKEVILSKQFDSRLHFSSKMILDENKGESKTVAEVVAKAWPIQNGEVISDAIGKWAALSGWGVPIWEAQELMSTSNVVLLGTFEEAIQQMVDSFERQGIVLRVTFYSENKVIRIRQGNV